MHARSALGSAADVAEPARVRRAEDVRAAIAAPFGSVLLYAAGQVGLTAVELSLEPVARRLVGKNPLIDAAVVEFDAYFNGSGALLFTIPIQYRGTDFQTRVWQALRAIPVGTTMSYGALAAQLGSSARAVAAACKANPLPILVPCHRVVAAHGLGGYCGATAGPWLDVKRWLLQHEQACAARTDGNAAG